MRLARQNGVTVLLDGQGGDEILAGYYNYLPAYLSQVQQQGGNLAALRSALQISHVGGAAARNTLIEHASHRLPWRMQKMLNAVRPAYASPGMGGSGLKAWQLAPHFMESFYDRRWQPASAVDSNGLVGVLYRDLTSTNLPKLLRYEDRNSMAFSIETRLPFLDFRLVEMVFSLPLNYRIHNGWTKWILRQAMKEILPHEVVWRRTKLGFPTPEVKWFQQGSGYLRKLFRSYDGERLAAYLRPEALKQIAEQPDEAFINTPGLWRLINLMLWMDLYFVRSPRDILDSLPRARHTI
jgi:asparagine synthase (glutamine-hydrolysing)